MMIDYFMKLFEKDDTCNREQALKGKFHPMSVETIRELEKGVEDEEINHATMEMAPLKALGLDGLHAIFY